VREVELTLEKKFPGKHSGVHCSSSEKHVVVRWLQVILFMYREEKIILFNILYSKIPKYASKVSEKKMRHQRYTYWTTHYIHQRYTSGKY
jgi:hypothetical protein